MQKAIKAFRTLLITLMCVLTAGNVLIITAQVVLRYIMKVSIAWASEFAGISLVWITFLGATLATLDETNINFNNIIDAAKPLPKLILKILCKLLVGVALYVIIYYGYKTTLANANTMLVSVPISMAPAFAVVPVSGVFMAISIIINAVKDVKEYLGMKVERGDAAIYDDVPEEILQKATESIEKSEGRGNED